MIKIFPGNMFFYFPGPRVFIDLKTWRSAPYLRPLSWTHSVLIDRYRMQEKQVTCPARFILILIHCLCLSICLSLSLETTSGHQTWPQVNLGAYKFSCHCCQGHFKIPTPSQENTPVPALLLFKFPSLAFLMRQGLCTHCYLWLESSSWQHMAVSCPLIQVSALMPPFPDLSPSL